jgi:hypothetical protein
MIAQIDEPEPVGLNDMEIGGQVHFVLANSETGPGRSLISSPAIRC